MCRVVLRVLCMLSQPCISRVKSTLVCDLNVFLNSICKNFESLHVFAGEIPCGTLSVVIPFGYNL